MRLKLTTNLSLAITAPGGPVKRMVAKINTLESKEHASAVQLGGYTFKNAQSTC